MHEEHVRAHKRGRMESRPGQTCERRRGNFVLLTIDTHFRNPVSAKENLESKRPVLLVKEVVQCKRQGWQQGIVHPPLLKFARVIVASKADDAAMNCMPSRKTVCIVAVVMTRELACTGVLKLEQGASRRLPPDVRRKPSTSGRVAIARNAIPKLDPSRRVVIKNELDVQMSCDFRLMEIPKAHSSTTGSGDSISSHDPTGSQFVQYFSKRLIGSRIIHDGDTTIHSFSYTIKKCICGSVWCGLNSQLTSTKNSLAFSITACSIVCTAQPPTLPRAVQRDLTALITNRPEWRARSTTARQQAF